MFASFLFLTLSHFAFVIQHCSDYQSKDSFPCPSSTRFTLISISFHRLIRVRLFPHSLAGCLLISNSAHIESRTKSNLIFFSIRLAAFRKGFPFKKLLNVKYSSPAHPLSLSRTFNPSIYLPFISNVNDNEKKTALAILVFIEVLYKIDCSIRCMHLFMRLLFQAKAPLLLFEIITKKKKAQATKNKIIYCVTTSSSKKLW